MDTYKLRKACVSMGLVILFVIFSTSNAFSWGSATHAYIDDKIGKSLLLKNLNEIYGGMAPDVFNFYPEVLTSGTAYNHLYIQTHFNSLALWSEAQGEMRKASAFGFASHSNGQLEGPKAGFLGADYTAHGFAENDLSFYVNNKAKALWDYLRPIIPTGIIPDNATGLSISHNIIEFTIDIMVVYRMEGGITIGKKMIESVLLRTPEFPLLLVKTYAKGLSSAFHMTRHEAAEVIISAERDFRKTMLIYGQGLVQENESAAINYVASLLAQMANEIYGIPVRQEQLIELVKIAISQAQVLCVNDYELAINGTIDFVKDQMTDYGISY